MIPNLSLHDAHLRDQAARFASDVLSPSAGAWEEAGAFAPDAFRALCAMGLGATLLPESAGGAGLSNVGAVAVFEAVAYGDLAIGFALLCQNSCTRSIHQHGTAAQKARWLPPLTKGEAIGAYSITEPGAGSDPASMSSTGVHDGGAWLLNGDKCLLTNAPTADLILTSVKTEPDAGARGISTFLLPRDAAGLEIGERTPTLGARGLQLGTMRLNNCRAGDDDVLGELGGGFKIALDAVNFARVVWGGLAAGVARAALDGAIEYLGAREQFGKPLSENQAVQFHLADLATEIEAARLLAYRAAALIDAGERYIEAAAMAKRVAGDMAVRVTSEALELLGGRGFLAPNALERYMRQARMAQLADGAGNIQRMVIGRALVKQGAYVSPDLTPES